MTSVTLSGDLLLVKHNVDWKRVDIYREHLRSKACMETQKTVLHTLPIGKISVKAKNKQGKKRSLVKKNKRDFRGPHRAHSQGSPQSYST